MKYSCLLFFLFLQTFIVANSFSQTVTNDVHSVNLNSKNPAIIFKHPPESAKPGVLWMWMGSNISKEGITKDLEALKAQGFNRTTMFSLADVCTPWPGEIHKSPTPEIIAWTAPWWKLVRHAAMESKRLRMEFGMHNCAGYESSGGVWITPELSMQELCWSKTNVVSEGENNIYAARPTVDPRAKLLFPVFNPETGLVENPVTEARKTFYKDIVVLALPADGIVSTKSIINLSDKMQRDGKLNWIVPVGKWIIYRFGHTTMGTIIQPAQWKATGLECDKMSEEAVSFHMNHVITEIKNNIGDLIGTGFTHLHFDSYEAGVPTWTPKMPEEFLKRRGYDIVSYLPIFAGRIIESKNDSIKFRNDFDATIKDLYSDIYFSTIAKKLKSANLNFLCEPYGGPWRQDDIMPKVKTVMTEFWTNNGQYTPAELDATVASLRKSGQNIIEAEAFTGMPEDSKWDETPAWLKPIGDASFCGGVNRLVLHRFVHQPWDDKYKPGASFGQWGTHFDRTQTWWKPGKAMIEYWQRCQAVLQWGNIIPKTSDDFNYKREDSITINFIHRQEKNTDIFFVANTSRNNGTAQCNFNVAGRQPELWDPVTGEMKMLTQFIEQNNKMSILLNFAAAQSYFIVFRKKLVAQVQKGKPNFAAAKNIKIITGSWQVTFNSVWGGPAKPVLFDTLQSWTKNNDPGIKYYSGTAVYKKVVDIPATQFVNKKDIFYLDLGTTKDIAHVTLNGKDLGVIWTAPWRVKIPAGLLKSNGNQLQIEVTNVWANRLIGDEQEPPDAAWLPGHMGDVVPGYNSGHFLKEFPDWFLNNKPRPSKGRYCFTTWNYFTKDSPLIPSGLLGPIRIMKEEF